MRVGGSVSDDTDYNCVVSGCMDDYETFEQHHLNLVSQVVTEDMKTENRYYGDIVMSSRKPYILDPELEVWKHILCR